MYSIKRFIKNRVKCAIALTVLPKVSYSKGPFIHQSSKNLINIALIGRGKMAFSDLNRALFTGNFNLVGVCDVYDKRLEPFAASKDVLVTKYYKEILAMKNADAVIIATPRSLALANERSGERINIDD